MIYFKDKIKFKFLNTKSFIGLALFKSLARSIRDFVLLGNQTLMKKTLIAFSLAILLVPALSFASFDVSLKYGSKGTAVSNLQDFLSDQGYLKSTVDGKFGLGTLRAVEAFQTANNLKADGYFGKASRSVANDILASILAPSDVSEQEETGTNTTISSVSGCTDNSLFSSVTGQPCNSTVTPASNLPAGCTALSGYSMTTGQKCDGTIQNQLNAINTTLNTIAQNITPISILQTPAPIQNPVPIPAPEPLNPIQDSRWFSLNGKDYAGGAEIGSDIASQTLSPITHEIISSVSSGKVYIPMRPLKIGTIAILTMDDGNVYQLGSDNKFWITELNYDPTWIYAGTYKWRSWTINLSYQDPTNGLITGTITSGTNWNDLKASN